ncbi:hypothetical protein COV15_02760 [Candidatus Woesearchaeota archaeon CG10_big_fil_rev_8_21_14_0_10_34_12]|nr:MAG: hypothetical protein COV15_02760 [Candidatus Woesearchaeota archaeon CG10_big_fil_rev_8_21_14_0_10_34_12]
MRVAVYNQMFGLNGRNLVSALKGNLSMYSPINYRAEISGADINRTLEVVAASKSEIVGICEVLEGQEKELMGKLDSLGYKYFYFESGRKTKIGGLVMRIVIASKIKCEKVNVGDFPLKDGLGGGGGFIHCYFPELKLDVVSIHMGYNKGKMYFQQLGFLQGYLKKLYGNIILMGDFNLSHDKLKDYFGDLTLASNGIKSCSTTPVIKEFINEDYDHIFVRGFEDCRAGELEGHSDHKLIYVDLE